MVYILYSCYTTLLGDNSKKKYTFSIDIILFSKYLLLEGREDETGFCYVVQDALKMTM